MQDNISLDEIKIKTNRIDYYFSMSGRLQKYFKNTNHLYIEYNEDVSEVPESIAAIPFLANIIPLVWITDSEVRLSQLDQSFYECLETIKQEYQKMFPKLSFKGSVQVKQIAGNTYIPVKEQAALFSGGLDALTTYLRNEKEIGYLVTEYGWHNSRMKESDVWEAERTHAVNFAKEHNKKNILLQSNYGTFLNPGVIDGDFSRLMGDSWWHGLHHSLAITSAAIPMVYKHKIGRLLIASSFSHSFHVPCASCPQVDNQIKFASGTVSHDAFELTRQDKVKFVVDHFKSSNQSIDIKVCFRKEKNCSFCEKCLRTILGIVAEGGNPANFGFDLPDDLSGHVQSFLKEEVKFFTASKVHHWTEIQKRMKQNPAALSNEPQLSNWFIHYDFASEKKYALIKYRVTKFFPIVKRRIKERIFAIREESY